MDVPESLHTKPMPIDAYLETPRQLAVLEQAERILAAQCMRSRGYVIKVPRFDDLVTSETQQEEYIRSRWFGITDRGAAATYGFGDPPVSADPSEVDYSAQGASDAWNGTEAYDLGHDRGGEGCFHKARRTVLHASSRDLEKVDLSVQIRNDAGLKAQASPSYANVYGDLGRCLREAGYDVPNPERPFASKQIQRISGTAMDRREGSKASKPEVDLAMADIGCEMKVDLVRRLEVIVAAEEDRLIERNALALQEDQKKLKESLKRAAVVMAGKGIS